MASSRYSNISGLYNASEVELQKADITLAALLCGYMVKRGRLGSDETDMFFKLGKDKKFKSFAVPVGEKEISQTEKAVYDMQLGINTEQIDLDFYAKAVGEYDKGTMALFIDSIETSLVKKNDRDSENLKKFYQDRISWLEEYNMNRQISSGSDSERE